jgi:SPP1 gp7 family putative phage head morphogenesis protein
MADPDIRAMVGLPPEDTARAFDARGELRTTVRWSEMWHADHARAFTVAKVAKLDLLEDIRTSLADVLHNGGTFEQWKSNILPTLQRAGWWGRVEDPDLTGTADPVVIGPRRLRTIYGTNMRVSRAAGQWARIQERKDVAPYLRYSAVMDSRTRPAHRAWHGIILPVDHPWWDTHFPPCGWNCRCTVIQLSDRDLERNGWKVSAPPPEGPPQTFFRAGTKTRETVPAGIDPGFAYNPGKASMRAIGAKAAAAIEREAAADVGAARGALRDLVESPAFLAAMEEPETVFPVMVLDEAVRARLSVSARVVVLSSAQFRKLRLAHPGIGLEQYRQLPEIGADSDFVIKDGERRVLYRQVADGRWLQLVVKIADEGATTFVESLAWIEESALPQLD